jgi:hypothetical protein
MLEPQTRELDRGASYAAEPNKTERILFWVSAGVALVALTVGGLWIFLAAIFGGWILIAIWGSLSACLIVTSLLLVVALR